MRLFTKIALVAALLGSLIGCDKEDVKSRDYPRLRTLPATNFTINGAQLNAKIFQKGDYEIISYGFAWGTHMNPTIENADGVVYSQNISSNKFSAEINSILAYYSNYGEKNYIIYQVRAFIKTANYTVYGTEIEFSIPETIAK